MNPAPSSAQVLAPTSWSMSEMMHRRAGFYQTLCDATPDALGAARDDRGLTIQPQHVCSEVSLPCRGASLLRVMCPLATPTPRAALLLAFRPVSPSKSLRRGGECRPPRPRSARATRTTLVGSMIPASTKSPYTPRCGVEAEAAAAAPHAVHDYAWVGAGVLGDLAGRGLQGPCEYAQPGALVSFASSARRSTA